VTVISVSSGVSAAFAGASHNGSAIAEARTSIAPEGGRANFDKIMAVGPLYKKL